ncbi:S15/NS1 [Forsythia ovata]|uniref:S15/NS1 n=1 Tax=Forsythia ovata TaxID=205694 RepID=A0ABD1X1U0_9LAMI
MAATTKLILLRRPKFYPFPQPRPHSYHFYSSSIPDPNAATSQPDSEPESKSQTQNQSPFSSYFSDVKASLQKESSFQNRSQIPRKTLSFSKSTPQTPPSKIASLEEIRKNLSEFRRRSAVQPPSSSAASPSSHSGQPISFQELYKRNVLSKTEESGSTSSDLTAKPVGAAAAGGVLPFEAIRQSLSQLRSTAPNRQTNSGGKAIDSMSLSRFKESLKLKPVDSNAQEPQMMIGGSDSLPASIFGKEKRESGDKAGTAMRTEFVKMYSYNELGEKLKMLRPDKKKGTWFSLQELNERLMKLREIEEKESEARIGGVTFMDLRESLVRLRMSDDEKARKNTMQRLDVLGQLGGTPSFMLSPPKEHLVEKYFHPDNMSSC